MAATAISRFSLALNNFRPFFSSNSKATLNRLARILLSSPTTTATISSSFPISPNQKAVAAAQLVPMLLFSSSSSEATSNKNDNSPKRMKNTLVNFSLSSDEEAEEEEEEEEKDKAAREMQDKKTKLPPPYDPFNNKSAIEEPDDPKNLQEIFHKMRTEGLLNNAVKMFDALSKDGLTHEALELFRQIKDKGHMPDVVGHTAVMEAYAGAGQSKEALKTYTRMLACGVAPNAYTYAVLIKALAADPKLLQDAKRYTLEMMGKGMSPNADTYTAVMEAFVREHKEEDARDFLHQMKAKGFVPDEKALREVLNKKRGPVIRTLMNLLFDK